MDHQTCSWWPKERWPLESPGLRVGGKLGGPYAKWNQPLETEQQLLYGGSPSEGKWSLTQFLEIDIVTLILQIFMKSGVSVQLLFWNNQVLDGCSIDTTFNRIKLLSCNCEVRNLHFENHVAGRIFDCTC